MPVAPTQSTVMTSEPFGQVSYAASAAFAGQPRVGQLSSTRYVGVYAGGVVYFDSAEHLHHGLCVLPGKTAAIGA